MHFLLSLCVFGALVCAVLGHGYLADPPARSSAWRYGFQTPINYEDNALRCGGVTQPPGPNVRCGVCGDPETGAKDHEAGGKFAQGVIVRTYKEGEVVEVTAKITANHKGWMEFRICPNNDIKKAVTHDCLNRNLLELADGSGTRYKLPSDRTGDYMVRLTLPKGMVCTQCVIQWRYHAGNSWGVDQQTGAGGLGLGNQEEFYGCADVAIVPSTSSLGVTNTPRPPPPQPHPGRTTARPPARTTMRAPTTRITRPLTTRRPMTPAQGGQSTVVCRAINFWANDRNMDVWCTTHCSTGNCPLAACDCSPANPQARTTTTTTPKTTTTTRTTTTTTPTTTTTTRPSTTTTTTTIPKATVHSGGCRGKSIWANDPLMADWCTRQCGAGNCPSSACDCSPINPQAKTTKTAATTKTPTTTTTTPTTTTSTTTLTTTTKATFHIGGCRGKSIWANDPVMADWCTRQCGAGNCPSSACDCSPLTPQTKTTKTAATTKTPTTTTTTPTTTTSTTTPTTTTKRTTPQPTTTKALPPTTPRGVPTGLYHCKAINLWAGNAYLDSWCSDTCARGNCPLDRCMCTRSATSPPPTTTTAKQQQSALICKAIGVWKGMDLYDKWCNTECAKGNCAFSACSCTTGHVVLLGGITTPTTITPTTTTTLPPTTTAGQQAPYSQCYSNGLVGGSYWNSWCSDNCQRGFCASEYCFCS